MHRSEQRESSAPPGLIFGRPRQFRASVTAIEELGALRAQPEEIPEAKPCYACGGATVKTLVDYSYTYECNETTSLTATKTLPGYRCQQCGEIYMDRALDDRFLGVIAQALAGLVNPELQDELEHRHDDPYSFTTFTPLPTSVKK